jgi:hypothetical protein
MLFENRRPVGWIHAHLWGWVSVVVASVGGVRSDLHDLDASGLLAAATEAERAGRLAEVHKLELLSAWAAIHSDDPTEGPEGRRARLVGNVLRQVGGEGTPGVQDFCLGEIALARGAGVTATSHALADILDLEHRLPLTWAVCRRGECEVWVARRVARLSRHLPVDAVAVVDSAISRMIATEAIGRVLEVAVDAIVHRVGEILAPLHPEAHPDELRAIAFGWLARPAELLRLLLEHTVPEPDSAPEPRPVPSSRAVAFPADLLDALREVDVTPLAPKAVLHVHLHEAALHGGEGVARIEGFGPVTLTWLAELLRGTTIRVQPVKDLSDRVRYTAYEHPESLRDHVHLVTGGDYWPYAGSTSRTVDLDHPTPFDHGEDGRDPPPDQTGSHNSGPLGRRHHRWKTHAGYRSRQCGEGRYVWLTPHGLGFLVDHTGTHRIHPEKARMILDAPAGVDIYPG